MAKKNTKNTGRAVNKRGSQNKRNAQENTGIRTDIAGVIITALGIALLVAVISRSTGMATNAISWALKEVLGIGAYVLPCILIIWGISFFLPNRRLREGRLATGLVCLLLTTVGFAALAQPFERIFDANLVSYYGGFVGSALTWVLVRLTGRIIAGILLGTLGVIGCVVIGFSISDLFEKCAEWVEDVADSRRQNAVEAQKSSRRAEKTRKIDGSRHSRRSQDDVDTTPADSAADPTIAVDRRGSGDQETVKIDSTRGSKRSAQDRPTVAVGSTGPQALEGFELPSPDLLAVSAKTDPTLLKKHDKEARVIADTIVDTLNTFNVPSQVVDWVAGPTVTLFKIDIAKGIKLNKITGLDNELALALAAPTLRILAPIPGESLVGIEVPNSSRASVTLGDVLPPAGVGGPLALAIGKDVAGNNVVGNLDKMPHLLIAGTTGSGKSVAINSMIMSILMRATPSEVRFILVDPKRVEMALYSDIPHLYVPVVTEPQEAAAALSWAVTEMERRLKIFSRMKVRDIGAYNDKVRTGTAGEDPENLPFLVIIIDELADLMMVASKDVESSIVRIAQKARAAGIHLIVATQRPEAGIVTGLIKSNITNRIAFNVGSGLDSRVILDQTGAEQLTGNGDMLYITPQWAKPKRIQGCYVSTKEIVGVVESIKGQVQTDYHNEILTIAASSDSGRPGDSRALNDEYIWPAAEYVVSAGLGSTSSIQRKFSVGYARAGRIMDSLTELGVVGEANGSKPREVLLDFDGLDALRKATLGESDMNEDD